MEQKVLEGFEPALKEDPPWSSGTPALAGWYRTRRAGQAPTRHEQRRFYDGWWSEPVLVGVDDDAEAVYSAARRAADQSGIQWVGLDEPSSHGYGYALVLVGDFMTVSLDAAVDRWARRLP